MIYPKPFPGVAFGLPDPGRIPPSPRLPALEREVLAYWEADGTFAASIEQRDGAPEWVFYDGPPFANGLPHYGHLLTGYAKDVFPRYRTMRGMRVDRRFGWDTHGLPAELEAERQLGITDKRQIDEMGVGAFNAAARESVLRYTREWREYVTRQARWVDFDRDYKTLDASYMESVLWAFKRLHDDGLAYEGYRVLPYCWRDQTPLSNHELRMDDDVYQPRQDPSVTVTFPLVGEKAEALGLTAVRALAWTTTPWTLPTNAALAVGPDIEYAVVPAGPAGARDATVDREAPDATASVLGADYLLALARVGDHAADLGYASADEARQAVTRTIRGAELADVRYDRLFDFLLGAGYEPDTAWRVLVDDYVSTDEGTGIVHQAPAYGEDDARVCAAAGIPVVLSVDAGGRFLPLVEPVAGLQVFEANRPIIRLAAGMGRLLREASYVHPYPHCWRCRNPLIYRAVSSWFVRVTAIRDRMVELNRGIRWIPENIRDGQFGRWLEGARDWSVSRNRYWGTPVPVWVSDDPEHPRVDVYGSLAELEADFGRLPTDADGKVDLHRPAIDELTRPNPDDETGRSTMRRVPDVLDVWFDSGSMPFAQVHHPFENADWFASHSPADFIVEYIGQTRGWFYVQHVLSTALFDRPAFDTVVSHGIVLGSDGQKMSKSLRNYPDVSEVFDRDGSDAMRWFLMSSPVLRGGNLVVTEEGIREGVRQFLLPVWSTWYFLALYANASDYEPVTRTDSEDVLDRYLLAAFHDTVERVTDALEAFDATGATAALRAFADTLTNWYVRRSRDRFWAGADAGESERAAFDTLATVLEALARLAAPLAPLTLERVWQGLTGGRSVHLTDWPDAAAFPADAPLVAAMDRVRRLSSAVLALRKDRRLRVRQPLPRVTVVAPDAAGLTPFVDLIADELNVRTVELVELEEGTARRFGVSRRLSVNARVAGPRLGRDVQAVIRAAKAGDWSEADGRVIAGGVALEDGEYELALVAGEAGDGNGDGDEGRERAALALLDDGAFVLLDTTLDDDLIAEGLARDVVRAVQEARREAGLDVSDRIRLMLTLDADGARAVRVHEQLIRDETLAVGLDVREADGTPPDAVRVGEGSHVSVELVRA